MNDLFAASSSLTPIAIVDGELSFCERLPLAIASSDILFDLIAQTPWRAESIVLWGKSCPQPRLSAWYGDAGCAYRYSGLQLSPLPWTPLLTQLRQAVEAATQCAFNSVLLNYYRDQHDSMGMHSDDERELGARPAIASLTFGAARTFTLKHKSRATPVIKLALGDGCLLLMAGELQRHWRHGIAKTARACGPRVSLTFRRIEAN